MGRHPIRYICARTMKRWNCTIVAQIYEKTATLVAPQVLLTYFMLGLALSLLWALKSLKMQSLMLFFKIEMTMNTSEDKRSSPEPMNQTGVQVFLHCPTIQRSLMRLLKVLCRKLCNNLLLSQSSHTTTSLPIMTMNMASL